MSSQQFIITLLKFISLWIVFSSFGFWILEKLSYRNKNLESLGISFMFSLGVFTYASLIFGILGKFNEKTVWTIMVLFLLISLKKINFLCNFLLNTLKTFYLDNKTNIPSIAFTVVSLAILASLYLTSLQPPNASDELHYHMPQVKQIVDSGNVDLEFLGHYFYGNIPKFMELSFAWTTIYGGYEMAHLVNFSVFLSFIAVVYGILKKHFSARTAIFAILLLVTYDDLTWNATSGFIDTAVLSFEISSLLILLNRYINKDKSLSSLIISGSLMGLAFASKYSPAPTLLYSFILISWFNKYQIKKIYADLKYYVPGILIFGSFWYIKNLIKYQNPFYPFYFGHKGVPEFQYQSMIKNVQEFGPKTICHFYELISQFKTLNSFHVFVSFFVTFLVLFTNKKNRQNKVIIYSFFIFFAGYTTYWFFFATHQVRFLAPAIVIALILSSTLIEKIKTSTTTILLILIIVLLYKNPASWTSFWNTKLHLVQRQYGLGKIDKKGFLTQQFGCQYLVIGYLQDNNLDGAVIDNWSVWHAPSVSFYSDNNKFTGFVPKNSSEQDNVYNELEGTNFKYLYYNQDVKEKHLANTEEYAMREKYQKLEAEEYILKRATLLYNNGDCFLYKIGSSN